MILSQTSEHALRAVLHLAGQPGGRLARAADVAEALSIPRNYLSKIFHALARAGILTSTRGKSGGFRLAQPPEDITLLDVIREFDDMTAARQCLLGRPVCSDRTACAAHRRWMKTSDGVATFFRETTVWDLLRDGPARVDAA